ncbi:unnamed protein product, partial [Ectocarpus fasciculatus]
MVKYTVTATLASKDVLAQYTAWLRDGHIRRVVEEGGALQGDFSIASGQDTVQVISSFVFPDRKACDAYINGLAVTLRPEGVKLFVDTQKVLKFDRVISDL